jgi:hypothetical protein
VDFNGVVFFKGITENFLNSTTDNCAGRKEVFLGEGGGKGSDEMKAKSATSILLIIIITTVTLLSSQISTATEPSSMSVEENLSENQITITIDGDMSDWEGIEPIYEDDTGDTRSWSTNTTLLSIGSTAETTEQVPINDKVRDLKAVYVYNDTHAIYVRLDVRSLIENWSYPHMNASCYVLAFDTNLKAGSDKDDLGMACDTYTNSKACWERLFVLHSTTEAYVQDPDWATVDDTGGGIRIAQNVTAGAFELSIPLADFPTLWKGQPLAITVISFKPGEYPTSGTQQWLHAFDPDVPGTPGETWGDPGQSARGSDAADVMPGGVDGIDSLGRVKNFITVFGAEEVPSAFPWIWVIVAVVFIAVVVIVVVYLAKRRKKVVAK